MSDAPIRSFGRSFIAERGAEGGVMFCYLRSAVALMVCIPAGRESERAGYFIFALSLCFFQ